MKRTKSDPSPKSEKEKQQEERARSGNNVGTNNCSKICSVPMGGVRAKVKQHFCNIGSDSAKATKNQNPEAQNKAGGSGKKSGLRNGASHALPTTSSASCSSSSASAQSPSGEQRATEKDEKDKDYYVKHNVDSLSTVEKCPPKVGNQSAEKKGSNGHLRNKMWNLRDDESSSGNEGDEAASDHECCIYTYKGDQFADLPSSFFKLDLIAGGSDQAAEAELPKESVAGGNERSQSGSSPEMDFLEMDFDPGPSQEQDSEEDYDVFEPKVKTGDRVRSHSEPPNEHATENDLSRNKRTDSRENAAAENSGNDLGLASNFASAASPEPQPGPSSACLSYEFSDRATPSHDKGSDRRSFHSFSSTCTDSSSFVTCHWPTKGIWGNHFLSGDLCSADDISDCEGTESLPLWNAENLKIQGDLTHATKTYNLHSAFYHWIMAESLVMDKKNHPETDGETHNGIETAMIWSEQEACAKQITQISTSACGATAVINVMNAFNMKYTLDKVKESVATRLRAEEAQIPAYLESRSHAGATHIDIIRGIHETSNGALFARFFHMHPERDFSLSKWLSYWIKKGAVPIATLNLQNGKAPGYPIPDAWHHQMVFGVSARGIYLTNPLECVEEATILVKLCSPSVLKIKRNDLVSRWNSTTDLRPLMYHRDNRWIQMNVLGQVVNIIREAMDTVQGRVITHHITIPASYSSGITLVIPRDSPGYNELVSAPELPLLIPQAE